jgi:hypothetical protein
MATKPKQKRIRVIEKKLGHERAWGTSDTTGLIELDERLGEADRLTVLIHEGIHVADPILTEEQVCRLGKVVGPLLWSQGYRRTLQ